MAAESKLPDAEMDVLACLHRRGEATAREIREALAAFRPMAHGSVVTLLGRLERKRLVTRTKAPVGKAFVFRPTRRPSVTMRPLLQRIVNRVFGGDPVALVASLFDTRSPTEDEVAALQTLLDDLRRKRGHR